MHITFADRKLEKLANDDRKMVKELGKLRAQKFRLRLSQLRFASSFEDLRNLPGNYHELSGNRKGKWACDLDQPYRLIFTAVESPILTDSKGKYIWLEIRSVEIIELIDYH